MLKLYSYWRSTASYRVRIALNIKQLPYQIIDVDLSKNGGEQHKPEYQLLNPQQLVPLLDDEGFRLNQSMAILEYLEHKAPTPALLPESPVLAAQARAIAQTIVADIHPLNNLRVLNYLIKQLQISEQQKADWYGHWINRGFHALETQLQHFADFGPFCLGAETSLADICLIPQVYNANRFAVPLADFPRIRAINEHCLTVEAFVEASPKQN